MTWQEYLVMVVEAAKKVCAGYDLPYKCVVAQGAIESQWGRYGIGNGNFNIFGRKYSGDFDYIWCETQEDDGQGNLYTIDDRFVSYPSMGDAINDWCQLMIWRSADGSTDYKQYAEQYWRDHDLEAFCRGIASIYATDINYGDKIMNTIAEIGEDM